MIRIDFVDHYTLVFERDMIEFFAVVDGEWIPCAITVERMQREFGGGGPATFEKDFLEHRPQIEEWERKNMYELLEKLEEEQAPSHPIGFRLLKKLEEEPTPSRPIGFK